MILTKALVCMDLTGNPIEGTIPEEICNAPNATILSTCDLGNSDCSCCQQCSPGTIVNAQVCDWGPVDIDSIPTEVTARFLGYDFNSTASSD